MALDIAFLQANFSNSNLTTYTFSGENLGAADAGRLIVVCVQASGTVGRTFNSVTIGGVSATIIQDINDIREACVASAIVPTGTTGDIVVVLSGGNTNRCAIQVYRTVGADTATPYDSTSAVTDDPSSTIDCPAGGCIVGCAVTQSNSSSATWTGITEDHQSVIESLITVTSASDDFGSTQTGLTVTCDFSVSSGCIGVYVSFQPAAASGTILDGDFFPGGSFSFPKCFRVGGSVSF